MVPLSLLLNVVVLIPVCYGIATDAGWALESYGENTAGRAILLSVYLSILLVSIGLIFIRNPAYVAALLIVQIIYKLITPIAVGTLENPVVISNILIAVFHTVTVVLILRGEQPLNTAS